MHALVNFGRPRLVGCRALIFFPSTGGDLGDRLHFEFVESGPDLLRIEDERSMPALQKRNLPRGNERPEGSNRHADLFTQFVDVYEFCLVHTGSMKSSLVLSILLIHTKYVRRRSTRHPVAVLRRICDLGQKELAALIGCKPISIQRIERNGGPNSLRLSEELATRIEIETGASVAWLLDGNPKAPAVLLNGKPLTLKAFEEHRARRQNTGRKSLNPGMATIWTYLEIRSLYHSAARKPFGQLIAWKLQKAIEEIAKEFDLQHAIGSGGRLGAEGDFIGEVRELLDADLRGMGRLLIFNRTPQRGFSERKSKQSSGQRRRRARA